MRKKKKPEHANHERWLVSYADFITLLFAFFVVLYSSAQVDKRRVGQVAMAIQVAFQQMGIFDASNTRPPTINTEPMPFSNVQMVENAPRNEAIGRLVNSPQPDLSNAPSRQIMLDLQSKLQTALAPEIQKHTVTVTQTREGIVVSLKEVGFFDSGSPNLRPDALPTVSHFIGVVRSFPVRIRIEGHTDNVPIHTARFDTNWELSTARATEMIKLFIAQFNVAPNRLSASGYGEYYPIAPNDTPEGRAQNRRVDLVIVTPTAEEAARLLQPPPPNR
jgi:chemotaxis protein MotB